MQSRKIQKHQSNKNHSGSSTIETEAPSGSVSVDTFRFPVMSKGKSTDVTLTPQNIHFFQRIIGNHVVGNLIQTKLKIGQPGDKYEQEADRVAEQVMRMPDSKSISDKNSELRKKYLSVQMKPG